MDSVTGRMVEPSRSRDTHPAYHHPEAIARIVTRMASDGASTLSGRDVDATGGMLTG